MSEATMTQEQIKTQCIRVKFFSDAALKGSLRTFGPRKFPTINASAKAEIVRRGL